MRLPTAPPTGRPSPPSDARALIDYVRSITPRSSGDVIVSVGANGTTFRIRDTAAAPPAAAGTFPFKIFIRPNPTNPYLKQARVEYNSSLLKSYKLDDRQTITGLTQYNGDGSVAESSWFLFTQGNDLIWLEITLDGYGDPTAATIKSYGLGGSWAPGDAPQEYGTGSGPFEYQVTYDDYGNSIYTQYLARIQILASVTSGTAGTDGSYAQSNSQLLNTHLRMTGENFYGTTADGVATMGIVMPTPYAGPYVQT